MKNLILVGLILIIPKAQAGFETWKDLRGCYNTMSYNGNPVVDPENSRGMANSSPDFMFGTLADGSRVPTFSFYLFKYRQGNTSFSDFAWIFADLGNILVSADGKTRSWSFKGPMMCTTLCGTPTPFTMNTRIEVKDLGNDLIEVHNFRHIAELPDHSYDADDTYILKRDRQFCTLCEGKPDGSMSCSSVP